MSTKQARALLAASITILVIVAAAWRVWPSSDPSADLVAGPEGAAAAPSPQSVDVDAGWVSVDEAPVASTAPPAAAAEIDPVTVIIPSIGVNAEVVPVGLQPDRQMEIPPAAQVGWYRLGPRPGAAGSAVLAGHIDFGGERGSFFALGSVQVGDEVRVVGRDMAVRTFRVSEREQLAKAEVDLARYFTDQGPTRLTLITCGGAFDDGSGHYLDNIIITAVPA